MRFRPDPGNQFDSKRYQKFFLGTRWHIDEAARFCQGRGDFADDSALRKAGGGRQPQFRLDSADDLIRGFQRRAEKPVGAGEIDDAFIDGDRMHFGRVSFENRENFV